MYPLEAALTDSDILNARDHLGVAPQVDVARPRLALEPLELDTLVLDTVRSLRPSLQRRVRVEAPPNGQRPELDGDVRKLMQLTRCLLVDAIGASGERSRVVVVRTGTCGSSNSGRSQGTGGHASHGDDLCYLEVTRERAADGPAAETLGREAVLSMVSPGFGQRRTTVWQTLVQHHGAVECAKGSATESRVTVLLPR